MAETDILHFTLFLEILRPSKLEIGPSYREIWLKKYVQIRFSKILFFGSKMCCSCWNFVIFGHFWSFFSNYNVFLTQKIKFSKIWSVHIFLIISPYNLAKFQFWRTSKSPEIAQNMKYQFWPFKVSRPIFSKKK